jgi:hypothetical protein
LTYLERQKCHGPDKKILFKKQLFDLEVNGQGPTKVITVCDTPPYAFERRETYCFSLIFSSAFASSASSASSASQQSLSGP